ncbi:MAG: bacillithiol biosynthesis BshC [Candidatus Krumholzibacteriia bacterium]
MKARMAAGAPLGPAVGASALFAAWCAAGGDGPSARDELAAVAAAPDPGPAPWFVAPEAAAWAADLAADLPDDAGRQRLAADLRALARGEAGVVVTGQQPGFLGGPLYTLYKIATAVALARRLTAAGRPTLPVFWSGDDDDDLAEAFAPVAWSVASGMVRSEQAAAARRGLVPRRRVGTLPAGDGQGNGLAWLAARGGAEGGAPAVADLWTRAAREDWTWARLQRRALLQAFAGTGLLVVSGDDPRLHRTAAPLYGSILPAVPGLARATRARGADLAAAGWHAQLADRATARPLFLADGDGRTPLPDAARPDDTGDLRPGVMLRSPVQDWLLRPRAVVVGPGEYAYLRQLVPVYAALQLRRSPLVPRLCAWLLPEGFDRSLLARFRARPGVDEGALDRALDRWQDDAAAGVHRLLAEAAALPPARAEALAAGRLRRWRRGLEAAVRGGLAEQTRRERPRQPAWVFPDGGRQERHLAWAAALALWGAPLVGELVDAAARHLDHGGRGDWREWEITVPPPEETA